MRTVLAYAIFLVLFSTNVWAAGLENAVSFDADGINAVQTNTIRPGANGDAVVRAQVLLARAHFSCGQVDGDYGTNLEKTVAAFQRSQNLPANGTIGADTWNILNQDKAPVLVTYTITPEDEEGPFVRVPSDMMEQAKLSYLGYASPSDELSEKFHESPVLLEALNRGKDFSKAGEELLVVNAITQPPAEAASVVVSKSDSSVTALDSQGKILAYYVATVGSEHDPLPIGVWKIVGVARNPVYHYNPSLFWDANPHDAQAVIQAGPRNPVGVVWMDLSKEHYGIHGTPDPSAIGHSASHGCIRLTNWDAWQLAGMVKPGTPAILQQ